jgi:hypothetical protein
VRLSDARAQGVSLVALHELREACFLLLSLIVSGQIVRLRLRGILGPCEAIKLTAFPTTGRPSVVQALKILDEATDCKGNERERKNPLTGLA